MGHYTEANEVRTRTITFLVYEGRKIVAACDSHHEAQECLTRLNARRPGVSRFVVGTTLSEPLYGCDHCDGLFTEDNMASLGGDRYIEGYAPTAVPATCQGCQDEWTAQFLPRRRAVSA